MQTRQHMRYLAEPIAKNGRPLPSFVTTIRRTYVSDHNAFASQNCLAKYANPKYDYRVYRNNTLIFTGKLHKSNA